MAHCKRKLVEESEEERDSRKLSRSGGAQSAGGARNPRVVKLSNVKQHVEDIKEWVKTEPSDLSITEFTDFFATKYHCRVVDYLDPKQFSAFANKLEQTYLTEKAQVRNCRDNFSTFRFLSSTYHVNGVFRWCGLFVWGIETIISFSDPIHLSRSQRIRYISFFLDK